MPDDPELAAMEVVRAALSSLDPETASRVLRWAAERHKIVLIPPKKSPDGGGAGNGGNGEHETIDDIGTFYDMADPKTDADKVLVAGYWYQVIKGQAALESLALNKELKNLGHGVGNITRAVKELMKASPRLMIQLKKQGSTKQARTTFKVTSEGIKSVRAMLKKPDTQE